MSRDPFFRLNELIKNRAIQITSDVVPLHVGDPKGNPNSQTAKFALENTDFGRYHPLLGIQDLKEAIQFYSKQIHGVNLKEDQIAAVQGTKSAIAWLPAIFNEKRKVSIPDLAYSVYFTAPKRLGKETVFYLADQEISGAHSLDYLIINTPHNPLGRVIERAELARLAKQAQEEDFIAVSDECYIDIYTGKKPTSLLEVDTTGDFRNLLVLNSLSKSSSIPGLRSGYIAGDSRLIKKFSEEYGTTGNTLSIGFQKASALAWRNLDFIKSNRERYVECLNDFSKQMNAPVPEGGFYFFLETPIDSEEFVVKLLSESRIKLLPGKYLDYSDGGRWDNYVRIPVAEKLNQNIIGALKNAFGN